MVKLKEEFYYENLARRLDVELDKLVMEHERQQKAFEDEIERMATEAQDRLSKAEKNYINLLEKEKSKYEKDYMDLIRKLEDQLVINQRKNEDSHIKSRVEFDHSISDNFGETEGGIGGHVLCAINMSSLRCL
ncbi:Kinesin-like protein [Arachis hypogaea]|nr:Kinesin-like protein [Arachis hypogaea]